MECRDSPGTISLTTEKEHTLYRRYKEEREERVKLEGLVNDLQNQIDILQKQLKCFADINSAGPAPTSMEYSTPQVDYNTDEEELARETEWIRTKTRKKRKLNTSPSQDISNPDNKNKNRKPPQPPPIIVDGVTNYQCFYDFLKTNQPDDAFSIKMMNGGSVKVNAANGDTYRALTKVLADNNCAWHSYENKQERPIRVMVKKLPSSCKPERIVDDLKTKGFKITEAVNKLSWKTKEPLNMFMITFSNEEDINKIFRIKTILGCVVEIQPLRTNKLIPQCKKCQAYGHTQKYCAKEPRCVKCTGKHLTRDCKKPKDEKPKCVHCGAPHPANYRGCLVAKEIQQLRNKAAKKAAVVRPKSDSRNKPKAAIFTENRSAHQETSNMSYAQAAKSSKTLPQVSTNDQKLDNILKIMLSFDERLKKMENSAKGAISKQQK